MNGVRSMGYIGLAVKDLAAWEAFATQVLGLESCGRGDDGALRLRMDEYAYRFALHADEREDVAYLGWEVADAAALAGLQRSLEAIGVACARGAAEFAEARGVMEVLRFADPDGLACEAYYGPSIAFERPFHSPRAISGFVTGENGVGHAVLTVGDIHAALRFYCDGLGFRLSDVIELSLPDGHRTAYFLHCNGRHHTIALAQTSIARRLLHFMLEVRSLDDVGLTLDAVDAHGVPLAASLGRHVNDHMLSFYMRTPSGFEVEYGWGARLVDDAGWVVQRHHAGSIWGHHRPGK